MAKGKLSSLKPAALLILIFNFSYILNSYAQNPAGGNATTLDECVSYALQHQPHLLQTRLDEDINRSTTRIAL